MTLLLPEFHLSTFVAALDEGTTEVLVHLYHPDARIRVLHLDEPRESLELIHGHCEIDQWLRRTMSECVSHRVVKILDSGHCVTFYEERVRGDGVQILAMNTAEIHDGLISCQYAVLGWDVPAPQPPEPWWWSSPSHGNRHRPSSSARRHVASSLPTGGTAT